MSICSKPVEEMTISECITYLKDGIILYKCEKGEMKDPARNFIDYHECNFICRRKGLSAFPNLRLYKKISIYKMDEVRPGLNTLVHQQNLKMGIITPRDADKALAFIFGGRRKTLNFLACNKRERDICVRGFSYLIEKFRAPGYKEEMNYKDNFDRWIHHCFVTADKDENGKLTFAEAMYLLQQMHSNFDALAASKFFMQADDGKDMYLTESEFVNFYRKLLHRKEIEDLMQKWNDNNKDHIMTVLQLQRFLKQEQNVELSLQNCEELIRRFTVSDELSVPKFLSLEGFHFLLLSKDFDAVNQRKSNNVYQNMEKPLTDYFICTSHNTYLLKGQLKGKICTEAYVRALSMGCRCLEHVQEGSTGEPVIYHKNTLTEINAIFFSDALKAISEHAFEVSSFDVEIFSEASISNICSLTSK